MNFQWQKMKINKYNCNKKIQDIAKEHNIEVPEEGLFYVAEGDNGEIGALVGLRIVVNIEPFISKNPLMGKKLWDSVKQMLISNGIKILRCYAKPEHVELYKKLGFYEIFNEYKPMEINFYNKE